MPHWFDRSGRTPGQYRARRLALAGHAAHTTAVTEPHHVLNGSEMIEQRRSDRVVLKDVAVYSRGWGPTPELHVGCDPELQSLSVMRILDATYPGSGAPARHPLLFVVDPACSVFEPAHGCSRLIRSSAKE
jgi:hypothetical protein